MIFYRLYSITAVAVTEVYAKSQLGSSGKRIFFFCKLFKQMIVPKNLNHPNYINYTGLEGVKAMMN